MWLLCLPQGIWVPGWTPTWICLLMYPKLCGSACYYLYNIRRIRKFLSREHTEQLVHAFITSRLDHCNRPLYSVLDCQIMKLQRVMDANARFIYCARKFCHITPIRIELHRLPVRRRIKFKILLIVYKVTCIKILTPKHLSDLIAVLPSSNYGLLHNYYSNTVFSEKHREEENNGWLLVQERSTNIME